jgi:hypothetical protein
MVRLGAPLIFRTDPELALYGRYVMPERLLKEGFEVRTTTFVPADAVTRQSGKDSLDAIVVTLQKDAASAVCFYTLRAYVSKELSTLPACTVHR